MAEDPKQSIIQKLTKRFGPIEEKKPFLEGILIKKNKWFMNQERDFRIFISGLMTYYVPSTGEEKGSI